MPKPSIQTAAHYARLLGKGSGVSRRQLLAGCANGFGALAFRSLLAGNATAQGENQPVSLARGLMNGERHHPAKVERVIFLFMDGAPSQVDTFDPKPRLEREHGQPIGMKIPATQFDDVGSVLASPFKFSQHGESGIPVSDLFPEVAKQVDKLCVVRSMVAKFPEHTSANYFLHTGSGLQGRPSMGSWMSYGLGTDCENLPGFVVLNGGLIPPGGLDNFNSGFLPASFQGSIFNPGPEPVANLKGQDSEAQQRRKLTLIEKLDDMAREQRGSHDAIESAIANYELAFRMQSQVPGLVDMTGESELTRKMYGLDHEYEHTRTYGSLCLLARRLVEQGVRFIELTCPSCGSDRWDQHQNLERGHRDNARAVDQPIAGLLADLEGRGLLDSTLVVWGGEFGRTPMAQGTDGRDHNPHGFSMWLAGGGIKAGSIYGATDDYGYFAVQDKVTIHDLHATILHLLGVDHKQMTFRFSGRDMRLTDVHGEIMHGLLS